MTMIAMKGSVKTGLDVLRGVETPPATPTYQPIAHHELVDLVEQGMEIAGIRRTSTEHILSKNGQRYFGLFGIKPNNSEFSLQLGLRNDHGKRFGAGLVLGRQVIVCSNLVFTGSIKLSRKHTPMILHDLPLMIEKALRGFSRMEQAEMHRIDRLKVRELSEPMADHIVVQSMYRGVIPSTFIPKVLGEYRNPRHPEFKERTLWSLENAFTEVMKTRNVFGVSDETIRLSSLLESYCLN